MKSALPERQATAPSYSLSNEDYRDMANVRRNVWINGFKGLGIGSFLGVAVHETARVAHHRYGLLRSLKFSASTRLLSFMAGGAFVSFLMACSTGKQNVHELYPLFQAAKEVGSNKERGFELYKSRKVGDGDKVEVDDLQLRQRNRFIRRATLTQSLVNGRGLSDSHGGQWVDDAGQHK